MAIGAGDGIFKFGTQDTVTTGTPGSITDGSFSVSGDVNLWTNDDDAPFAIAVLSAAFGATPTVGNVILLATLHNIDGSTGDENDVDSNYEPHPLAPFVIDWGTSASSLFSTDIFPLPAVVTSQQYRFFLKNNGTGQTLSSSWSLKVTPIALGPHA